MGFQIFFRIRGQRIKKKSNNCCCWFQLFWKTHQIFAWKNQQGSFKFSFPKNIENHLLHTYIYIKNWVFWIFWESQLIWTLRTNLMIPDKGLVQLLIPAQQHGYLLFTVFANTCSSGRTELCSAPIQICHLESGNLLWSTTLEFQSLMHSDGKH